MEKRVLIVDDNIALHELGREHAREIFDTINTQRAYLGQWLPFVELTTNIDFTLSFVEAYAMSDRKNLTFAIYYRDQFAGLIGLKDTDYANLKTEIGYWLSEPFQQKGIITLSCNKLLEYAFQELNMNRVQLKAATGNAKSCSVALRLGFTLEGVERDGELHSRGFVDLNVYSLLVAEFGVRQG
jgi:ribosomal-protein-serine acetyltransferase